MTKSISYYRSKGFDDKTSAYFASGRKRVVSVSANTDFTLVLKFDNGETRIFDASALITPGSVFAFLSDFTAFRRVYVDENGAVAWDKDPAVDSKSVWSNRVDISSDTCYLDSIPQEVSEHA